MLLADMKTRYMAGIAEIRGELGKMGDPVRARVARSYFRTAPGGYGHGDVFLGVSMPKLRSLAGRCRDLEGEDLLDLLRSGVHEERMLALLILVHQYEKGGPGRRQEIFDLYVRSTGSINNWDLVDMSAPRIVGRHLMERDKALLYRLAASKSLWERRIAVLSTLYFIRNGLFEHTLALARILLSDKEDLVHKAVGWMLREVGKQDIESELVFLKEHYRDMPRTMLRYAVERFPEEMRQDFLKGRV